MYNLYLNSIQHHLYFGTGSELPRLSSLCSNSTMDAQPKRNISAEKTELLRQIPSVDELLACSRLSALLRRVDRNLVLEVTRAALAEMRERIVEAHPIRVLPLRREEIESAIADEVERILSQSLVPVINATGVVLHTNLGRAPLLPSAAEEILKSATRYSNLENDLEICAIPPTLSNASPVPNLRLS